MNKKVGRNRPAFVGTWITTEQKQLMDAKSSGHSSDYLYSLIEWNLQPVQYLMGKIRGLSEPVSRVIGLLSPLSRHGKLNPCLFLFKEKEKGKRS